MRHGPGCLYGERGRYLGPFESYLWVVSSTGGTRTTLATVEGGLRGPVWSPDDRHIAVHGPEKQILVFPLPADLSSAGEPRKIELPRRIMNIPAGWAPEGELGVFMQTEQQRAVYTVAAEGGKAVRIASAVTPGGLC